MSENGADNFKFGNPVVFQVNNIITTVNTTNFVVQTVQKWSNGHP